MKRIHKYLLEEGEVWIEDPIEKWLTAQVQGDKVAVWAQIDTLEEPHEYYLYTLGTGWSCKRIPGEYVGTVQEPESQLVWHVFAARVHRSENVDIGWAGGETGEAFYVN